MTRDELIERMAIAICAEFYGTIWENTSAFRRNLCVEMATAALRAIEEAGAVVVPKEATGY